MLRQAQNLEDRLAKLARGLVDGLPIVYADGPVVLFDPSAPAVDTPEWPDVVLEDILDAEIIGD